jgi:MOSC domain-containing protein YiiM
MSPRIVSLRVGLPRTHSTDNTRWTTSFYKDAVDGPIVLNETNLTGDEQADLRVHGGPDKAVCVYPAVHYETWRTILTPDAGPGWFGENFTVSGLTEASVAIGDTYRAGTAIVQVSQPRSPCWKLARRWNHHELPQLVVESGRTGWYLRVLQEGTVENGNTLEIVDRPFEQWTIDVVNGLAYTEDRSDRTRQLRAALAACPALSDAWREALAD